MSEACSGGPGGGAARRNKAVSGAAEGLRLAAAPTFALMALVSGAGGPADMPCSAGSPLSGMVLMYLLMGVFHAPPWLQLISGWRNDVRGG
jgi:hypothetical protein